MGHAFRHRFIERRESTARVNDSDHAEMVRLWCVNGFMPRSMQNPLNFISGNTSDFSEVSEETECPETGGRSYAVLSGVDEMLNERPSRRDKGATADHEAGREELRSGA
jgi:hypothetical protein